MRYNNYEAVQKALTLKEEINSLLSAIIEEYQFPNVAMDSTQEVDEYMQEVDYEVLVKLLECKDNFIEFRKIIQEQVSPSLWEQLLKGIGGE